MPCSQRIRSRDALSLGRFQTAAEAYCLCLPQSEQGRGLCSARLGATIVRFTMLGRAPVRLHSLLLGLFLLVPVGAAARPQNNFTYGPLPVFELHSGFWINLHHTLYHEAKLRTTAAQADK